MRVKKMSVRWLRKHGACGSAIRRFKAQKETDPIKIIERLIPSINNDWADWLIDTLMSEEELDIWDKKCDEHSDRGNTYTQTLRSGIKILKGEIK